MSEEGNKVLGFATQSMKPYKRVSRFALLHGDRFIGVPDDGGNEGGERLHFA